MSSNGYGGMNVGVNVGIGINYVNNDTLYTNGSILQVKNKQLYTSYGLIFQNLVFLDLYDNQIERIANLEGLPVLSVLLLGKNRISDISGLSTLRQTLRVLDLHGNKITSISNRINCLSELKSLNLAGNQIRQINQNDFQGLHNLKELNLKRNKIKRISGFQHLCALERLWLCHNELQRVDDMASIAKATSLLEVTIENNPVSLAGDCVSYLVSYLPQLQSLSQMPITEQVRRAALIWRRNKEQANANANSTTNSTNNSNLGLNNIRREEVISNARTNWELLRSQQTVQAALLRNNIKPPPCSENDVNYEKLQDFIKLPPIKQQDDIILTTTTPITTITTTTNNTTASTTIGMKVIETTPLSGSSGSSLGPNVDSFSSCYTSDNDELPIQNQNTRINNNKTNILLHKKQQQQQQQGIRKYNDTKNRQKNLLQQQQQKQQSVHKRQQQQQQQKQKIPENIIDDINMCITTTVTTTATTTFTTITDTNINICNNVQNLKKNENVSESNNTCNQQYKECDFEELTKLSPNVTPSQRFTLHNLTRAQTIVGNVNYESLSTTPRLPTPPLPPPPPPPASPPPTSPPPPQLPPQINEGNKPNNMTILTSMTTTTNCITSTGTTTTAMETNINENLYINENAIKPNSPSTTKIQSPKIISTTPTMTTTTTTTTTTTIATTPSILVNPLLTNIEREREREREQGGDYLIEICGRYLNIYGQGALRFIDKQWNVTKANDVHTLNFSYINFNNITSMLARIKLRFSHAENFVFRETNINCLGQLNALAELQGITTLHIDPEGNPITTKDLWRQYAIYRLSHWGLKQLNGQEVNDSDIQEANEMYAGLSDLVLWSMPDVMLQPLLTRLRLDETCLASKMSPKTWLMKPENAALRLIVGKEALQWKKAANNNAAYYACDGLVNSITTTAAAATTTTTTPPTTITNNTNNIHFTTTSTTPVAIPTILSTTTIANATSIVTTAAATTITAPSSAASITGSSLNLLTTTAGLSTRERGRIHFALMLENTCNAVEKLHKVEQLWPSILLEIVRNTLLDYSQLDIYIRNLMQDIMK